MARTMTTGKYFDRVNGVRLYIGPIVRETFDKIVVFGERNHRYNIPKSKIQTVGRNVFCNWAFNIENPLTL
jgi:hypothetical protein